MKTFLVPLTPEEETDCLCRLKNGEQGAKKAKDFARADAIRDELLARGITIKDTREGVVWERNA